MSLKRAIKAEAKRLGFDLVGVTTAEPPAHFDTFRRWLEQGYHGEMAYLASERSLLRRADPREVFPACRSILVVGLQYAAPGQVRPGLTGRVAAYARGEDYHTVLPRLLQALISFIEGQIGSPIPHLVYTDTGPLLERELAQRAGLGWVAKNSCLVNPRLGSYFLLAEILLGIELEPDVPFIADRCGSCTRCIQACPTGCILPERTVDARRCISYLTIELKGVIPRYLRSQMDNWVFGCDMCQQVCPWNRRFALTDTVANLEPFPDLLAELALNNTGFNLKFKDTPLKRARRRGYLRNVIIALSNRLMTIGIQEDIDHVIPFLTRLLLEDEEALVRAHAAWALQRLGTPAARTALSFAQSKENDPSVLDEIRAEA